MKRIYALMLAAVCAICLAGCVKESLSADEAIPQGEEMIICGTMGDLVEDGAQAPADTPDTRTQVRNTKEVWWNSGDRIAVFMSSNTMANEFTSTLTSGLSKTSYFSGTIKKTGSKYYVGYPYSGAEYSTSSDALSLRVPSAQTALSGSFYPNTLPSYGSFTSSSKNFTMKPAAGGLKFHVSRDDIKSVKFEGNNGEKVAGTVTVAKLSKTPDISRGSSGSTGIMLKRSGSTDNLVANKDYFIVITPGSLSKGFTITLTTDGGKKYVVTTSKKITIKAGVFGTLAKPLNEYASAVKEYVDLGLPSGTKWATFNVGAEAPEEYGDYFAWGETEPKTDYSWSTYKWCYGSNTTLTKYNTAASYGTVDHKILLDANDDAATANWGSSWRMPSVDEWTELFDNCTWTWTTKNGVNGQLVTSKTNSNSIFLPATGMFSTILANVGTLGYYLSSSLSTDYPYFSDGFYFTSNYAGDSSGNRFFGKTVRPVYGALVPVTSIEPLKDCDLEPGETEKYTATVSPDNATDKRVSWGSSDESIAKVSQDGTVTAVSKGKATITAYSADGSKTASCTVTVAVKPQAVDLGLPSGTKWATFNVGASAPEDYGDYFAWGETEPKADYSWETYKWCNGSNTTLTRYCPASKTDFWGGSGSPDGKFLFKYYDYEDDAARVNWGGSWCMPTEAEWEELQDNCTWTWTTQNGVNGRLVTGSNSNSIFLPAAGYRSGTSLYDVGSVGYYWSSYLATANPSYAYRIGFNSDRVYGYYSERGDGFSVRPVMN